MMGYYTILKFPSGLEELKQGVSFSHVRPARSSIKYIFFKSKTNQDFKDIKQVFKYGNIISILNN